jgi:hypothetical protein
LQSFRTQLDARRRVFVLLAGEIERQLREAYDRKYRAGEATQSSLAAKLGINRSAVHHRLMGRTNMTIETIADMVWALDHAIKVNIYDPAAKPGANYTVGTPQDVGPINPLFSQAAGPQPVGSTTKPGQSPVGSTLPDELKEFVQNAAAGNVES